MAGIGEKIVALRQQKNISQTDLATALNVSASAMCRWEKNSRKPSTEDIKRMADFFDVSVDFFKDKPESFINKYKKILIGVLSIFFCLVAVFLYLFLRPPYTRVGSTFVIDENGCSNYQEYYLSRERWDEKKASHFAEDRRGYLIEHSSYMDADFIDFYFYESREDYLEKNCIMLMGYYIEESD